MLKKLCLSIIILIALFAAAIIGYCYYQKPTYDGNIKLSGISETTNVYFDNYGVPHIEAKNERDAMVALGYVHAQDRLWQMELLRRIAPGKLSEILGNQTFKVDKFFAGSGIEESSVEAVAKLDKNSENYILAQAYLSGINQFLHNGKTPVEFFLLNVPKKDFTLMDVYNVFGYMSFSFAMAHKTDPLLTKIRDQYGAEYLKDLGIDTIPSGTMIKDFKSNESYSNISKAVSEIMESSPSPNFIGSNSWILSREKTQNGKVIFENDPHIGNSQPGVWYEAHIKTANHEIYGSYIAGTPFPLLGHNRKYAYGLTMFQIDDLDFYNEVIQEHDSTKYFADRQWRTFSTISKTIKVKDSADVKINYRSTIHGPLMNGLIDGINKKNAVSMSWIYTQQPLHLLDAVHGLSHAKNMEDFRQSVSLITAPGLNVMYGDAAGNVGWFAAGKLYRKPKGVNPTFILNGTNNTDHKQDFIPFDKNPSAVNPPWHYVYSANNEPEPIDGKRYPGYYLPPYRADRIVKRLESKKVWNKADVAQMALDNTSDNAIKLLSNWLNYMDHNNLNNKEKESINILKNWDGSNDINDIAPTIYNKWVSEYFYATFKDELGKDDFDVFLNTHAMKTAIELQSMNDNSKWWDDISTKNIAETKKQILTKAFKNSIAALQKQLGDDINNWRWGKVHTVEFGHPLGIVGILKPFFNVGPFETSGANEVINNNFYTYNLDGVYPVKGGPSSRRIIDFSDIDNSLSVLPTGQSGNFMSAHYSDQAELFQRGKYKVMLLDFDRIKKESTILKFEKR